MLESRNYDDEKSKLRCGKVETTMLKSRNNETTIYFRFFIIVVVLFRLFIIVVSLNIARYFEIKQIKTL